MRRQRRVCIIPPRINSFLASPNRFQCPECTATPHVPREREEGATRTTEGKGVGERWRGATTSPEGIVLKVNGPWSTFLGVGKKYPKKRGISTTECVDHSDASLRHPTGRAETGNSSFLREGSSPPVFHPNPGTVKKMHSSRNDQLRRPCHPYKKWMPSSAGAPRRSTLWHCAISDLPSRHAVWCHNNPDRVIVVVIKREEDMWGSGKQLTYWYSNRDS
ncbi:unnamed protein product [Bursaphelenchus xylophilus]|uniref:(pine wood nematode) hypothetical protein n=1 Tax=Bursaphelenchus xylophilus TaxID=6326 RepID=A0A1I7S519_BURXY|nr:unnamed protein product [Bursaphelenchus xylophilus]CAG9117612.1 unnamed protein product [Bursaphelenchus xylophilus]